MPAIVKRDRRRGRVGGSLLRQHDTGAAGNLALDGPAHVNLGPLEGAVLPKAAEFSVNTEGLARLIRNTGRLCLVSKGLGSWKKS